MFMGDCGSLWGIMRDGMGDYGVLWVSMGKKEWGFMGDCG